MSTFSYQGDSTQYGNKNRSLPRDQENLRQAAAANQGNEEGAGIQGAAERTGNLVDIASYGNLLNKGVDMFSKYNPKALLQSAGAVNSADGNVMKLGRSLIRGTLGTGKGPSGKMPKVAGLATVGNIGSEVFRAFDKEERSGFEALGEGIGQWGADWWYGDTSQKAMTPQELEAIRGGKNPNKPITETVNNTSTAPFNPSTGYGGSSEVVTGYESMKPKSQEELAAAANEDYASQFEGAYQNKDGSYTGLTTAGKSQSMTPEQYASYAEQQRLGLNNPYALPMGDYTSVAGTQGFVQQPLNYRPPVPPAPIATQATQATQAPQTSPQIEAQGNFAEARDSGTITPDKIRAAEEYAASMGRKFDPEMGYTSEFDPSILAKYNAERNASQQGGQQGGQYGGQQNIQQAQGRSSYATESAAREARMDARPDFGSAQMRNSDGKMVTATKETRAQRDVEKGLKQEARAAGYTPAQTRTYVADQMRERSESTSDRDFELKLREQNFNQGEANLAKTLKGLQEGTDVEEEDYFGIISGLGDLGVGIDTETGNLTYMKDREGWFRFGEEEVNLTPDSELYDKIMQMEGGAAFLAPPKYVVELLKTAKEGDSILSEDGTGRVYQVKNGKLVQIK